MCSILHRETSRTCLKPGCGISQEYKLQYYIDHWIVRPIHYQHLWESNVFILSKVRCRFMNKIAQFSKQNTRIDIYRGYYVRFTIINKILFIILIAWWKSSILDRNVKAAGQIIYSTEYCVKSSSWVWRHTNRCTNWCPDIPLLKTSLGYRYIIWMRRFCSMTICKLSI